MTRRADDDRPAPSIESLLERLVADEGFRQALAEDPVAALVAAGVRQEDAASLAARFEAGDDGDRSVEQRTSKSAMLSLFATLSDVVVGGGPSVGDVPVPDVPGRSPSVADAPVPDLGGGDGDGRLYGVVTEIGMEEAEPEVLVLPPVVTGSIEPAGPRVGDLHGHDVIDAFDFPDVGDVEGHDVVDAIDFLGVGHVDNEDVIEAFDFPDVGDVEGHDVVDAIDTLDVGDVEGHDVVDAIDTLDVGDVEPPWTPDAGPSVGDVPVPDVVGAETPAIDPGDAIGAAGVVGGDGVPVVPVIDPDDLIDHPAASEVPTPGSDVAFDPQPDPPVGGVSLGDAVAFDPQPDPPAPELAVDDAAIDEVFEIGDA